MSSGKYARLREHYHSVMYAKNNVLDGQFKGMMAIYDRMYLRYMPDAPADILDIACGAGQYMKWCDNHGHNVIGVDLSREHIDYINHNVLMTRLYNKAFCIDAFEQLANTIDTYDVVTANDFIEHMTKAEGIDLVEAIHRSLKPGGRIFLKTYNAAAFGGLVMWCNALDHECGYTERSLRALLEINGFKNVEIISYKERRRIYNWTQSAFHLVLRKMYKYLYAGNYPRNFDKIIAVTGTK